MDNLKVLTWNVRSIHMANALGHKKLKSSIKDVYDKFVSHDIICLQETWCTDAEARSMEDENFKVLYSNRKYRDPRAKRISGGVIVLVKKELWKGVKKVMSSSDDVLWVKLDRKFFKRERDMYLACAYLPPQKSSIFSWYDVDVCEMLELDVIRYSNQGDVLICGDLNARVGNIADYIENDNTEYTPLPNMYIPDSFTKKRFTLDQKSNEYGKWLTELCISAKLAIVNGRCIGDFRGAYTSHQPEGASVVDYNVISKSVFDEVNSFTVQSLTDFSDHCPLSINIKMYKPIKVSDSNSLNNLPPRYLWDPESADKLLNELATPDTSDMLLNFMRKEFETSSAGIDSAVSDFEEVIQQTTKKCLKRRVIKSVKKCKKQFIFNRQCYSIRCQLHYVKRLLERYPQNRDIRRDYYEIKRMYEKSVKGAKSAIKNELIEKLDELHEKDSKQYWDLFNKIRNNKKENNVSSVSASEWVKHYKHLYNKPEGYDDEIADEMRLLESCGADTEMLDQTITDSEIYDMIKKMRNGKSPGPDAIINEIIKTGKFFIVPLLKKIFNLIIEVGYFPQSWRKGYMVNILKAGSPVDPNNYRGITLSSCVGKLFSSIMNARLVNFLDVNKIYSMFQFGFREDCRTTDNIYILNKIMASYRNKKKKLYMCYIDFKKAFDKVWRAGLLLKILHLGIRGSFYNIVKSMYTDNVSAVKLNGQLTDYFDCSLGVRQGDGLSPTLFNLYINDLGNMFNSDDSEPAVYGKVKVGCLMYADDLVIMSDSKKGMECSLDKLAKYCSKWKLQINTKKSKIMICSHKRSVCKELFYLDTEELECVHKYKYLGLDICSNGSMYAAQDKLVSKGLKSWHYIRNSLYSSKVWPLNIYLKSYDTVIKPILLYGSEIWGQNMFVNKDGKVLSFQHYNHACPGERVQIRVYKQILGVQSHSTNMAVLTELGRYPITLDIIISIFKWYVRLENLERNCLLNDVYNESKLTDNSLEKLVHNVSDKINFSDMKQYDLKNKKECKKMIKDVRIYLMNYYENTFFTCLNSESTKKLCTYRHFKKTYMEEQYLRLVENPFERRMLTRFRISAHNLYIESGRYKKLKRSDRICKLCELNEVEDEYHFFMKCTFYKTLRELYIKELTVQYSHPYSWEAFLYVMQLNDKESVNKVATYVYKGMEKRKTQLYLYS